MKKTRVRWYRWLVLYLQKKRKARLSKLLLLVASLTLFGCADSLKQNKIKITSYDMSGKVVSVEESEKMPSTVSDEEAKAMSVCFTSIAKAEKSHDMEVAKLPDSLKALVLQADSFTESIALLLGKTPQDGCRPGTGLYDYMIADTEAANETRQKALSVVGGSIPYLAIGYVAKKGYDAAGSTNITGDNPTINDSFNETDVSNVGEGSAAVDNSGKAGSASGVDDNSDNSDNRTIPDEDE